MGPIKQQPPTISVVKAESVELEQPTPPARVVIHDDYCAIHDEYGTCTCRAIQAAGEQVEE